MQDDEHDASVTGEVVDPLAGTPGEWLTIERASDRLACAQRTIWRMIGDGKLRRRKVGRNAEVFVPTGMPPVGTPPSDMVPATHASPDTVTLAVIEELKRRDQDQASTIVKQAQRLGRLEAERDAALQRVADLEAAEHKRPWYRRWW